MWGLASRQTSLGHIFLAYHLHNLHPVQHIVALTAVRTRVRFLVEVDGVDPELQSGELVLRGREEIGTGHILSSLVHQGVPRGSESHRNADPLVTDGAVHMLSIWLRLMEIVNCPVIDA